MTIELYDSVALTHPITVPDADRKGLVHISEGVHGAVVMVYGDHEAYEVEFMEGGDSPYTLAPVTLSPQDVRLVERHRPVDIYSAAD